VSAQDDGAHELPELMTVTEVAAALRVSRATIYRLVHSGDLAGVRVGKAVRITRRAVQDFMSRPHHPATP
jgi:excisionase family DNA binding protein